MRLREDSPGTGRGRRTVLAGLCAAALLSGVVSPPTAAAQATPVPLGTAEDFAVLGATTVTNTGPSEITGDLGVSPGTAITGFPPGVVIGTIHPGDPAAAQAHADAAIAYDLAAGRVVTDTIATELGGTTVTPGVYDSASGTFTINGILTLDAQGDPDPVFIFKTATTLVTGADSSVTLVGGVLPSDVYWQVGSSATLGIGSALVGTVLAFTSITATTGAVVDGRLLAVNAAVTLDTNTITIAAAPVLSITGPETADLGSTIPGQDISGQIGPVTVDSAEVGSWTATVSTTAFTSLVGAPIPPADVSYWSGPVTSQVGVGAPTPGQPTAADAEDLAAPRTAFSMTAIDGDATLTWNPTLVVIVPLAAVAGVYTATVTHSVA